MNEIKSFYSLKKLDSNFKLLAKINLFDKNKIKDQKSLIV